MGRFWDFLINEEGSFGATDFEEDTYAIERRLAREHALSRIIRLIKPNLSRVAPQNIVVQEMP